MPNDYKACLVSNLTDYSRGDELLQLVRLFWPMT